MINDPFQAIEILKNEAKKAEFLATKEGRELLRKIETSYQTPWQKLQETPGRNVGGEKRMLNLTAQCNKDVDQLLNDLGEFEYYALLSKYIYEYVYVCVCMCECMSEYLVGTYGRKYVRMYRCVGARACVCISVAKINNV